jgi:hypothetical protein
MSIRGFPTLGAHDFKRWRHLIESHRADLLLSLHRLLGRDMQSPRQAEQATRPCLGLFATGSSAKRMLKSGKPSASSRHVTFHLKVRSANTRLAVIRDLTLLLARIHSRHSGAV